MATTPSLHQWLAVTITTTNVTAAWAPASTRSGPVVVRPTTTAISTAHPTWRLGMAAN